MTSTLVQIRFSQTCAPYNGGDVAGFAPDVAADFIRRKVAVAATEEAEAVLSRLGVRSVLDNAVVRDGHLYENARPATDHQSAAHKVGQMGADPIEAKAGEGEPKPGASTEPKPEATSHKRRR